MIRSCEGRVECLGYASFLARREPVLRRWFERLEREIAEIAASADGPSRRLVELQHALVDLFRELDPQPTRYADEALKRRSLGKGVRTNVSLA